MQEYSSTYFSNGFRRFITLTSLFCQTAAWRRLWRTGGTRTNQRRIKTEVNREIKRWEFRAEDSERDGQKPRGFVVKYYLMQENNTDEHISLLQQVQSWSRLQSRVGTRSSRFLTLAHTHRNWSSVIYSTTHTLTHTQSVNRSISPSVSPHSVQAGEAWKTSPIQKKCLSDHISLYMTITWKSVIFNQPEAFSENFRPTVFLASAAPEEPLCFVALFYFFSSWLEDLLMRHFG